MNAQKHAWMIMAHNNFEQLKLLLKYLDHKENDIYLHIDKKTKYFPNFSELIKNGTLTIIPNPMNVTWGGAQVLCELLLLKYATAAKHHDYYHLISASDLPIKKWSYIKKFFEENNGNEFVSFADDMQHNQSEYRIRVYHFFQDLCGRKTGLLFRILKKIDDLLARSMLRIGFARKDYFSMSWKKGDQWFSITESLALFILSKEKWIKRMFRFTVCSDEFLVQTIVANSDFINSVYKIKKEDTYRFCDLRYIDWNRGNPYVFREENFEELLGADENRILARKFDWNTDSKIIENVINAVME